MKTHVWTPERGFRVLKDGVSLDSYRARYPMAIKVCAIPSDARLEHWVSDAVCPALDGCRVEPDSTCEHDYPSWLLALGWI